MGNTYDLMRTIGLFSAATLFAASEAFNVLNETDIHWGAAPSNEVMHDLYCFLWGHDVRYGPCPTCGDNCSFTRYPANYFNQFRESEETTIEPEIDGEQDEPTISEPEADDNESDDEHKGDPEYQSNLHKLYPFMFVSFVEEVDHDGEFIKSEPKEVHDPYAPEECDPCAELLTLVAELRALTQAQAAELAWLKGHHEYHHDRW